MSTVLQQAKKIIRSYSGTIRTREALKEGIHPRTLYSLRDTGVLEQLTRGFYRLSNRPDVGDPDMVVITARIPNGVVCLISALAIHNLTTQIPHAIHLAIPRTARYPALRHPPIQVYKFSKRSFEAGIETRNVDGVTLRVYDAEKTIADCFKYRHKLGLDVVLEALKTYNRKRGAQMQRLLEYARINRVDRIMRPYLEALA